jgi:prepilin signal peptidase PulO-like enzyme (type II secretory pathway)
MEMDSINNPFNVVIVLILGICSGFLSNYFSDVLPINRKVGVAVCVNCYAAYSIRNYILYNKCSQCGTARSFRSVVVQVVFPILLVVLWQYPPTRLGFWFGAGLLLYFSIIFIIDLEYRAILQPVIIVGAVLLLVVGWILHGPQKTVIGGISGFGIMSILYYFGILFRKLVEKLHARKIDEVALGFGDVYLSGILGLVLGWPGITAGLMIAILSAGIVSIIFILLSKLSHNYKPFTAIPYAPFLILGAIILLYRP